MPHQHPADLLHDQAAANAKREKKRQAQSKPTLLSEREQLRKYQERLAQGVDGFKEIIEKQEVSGLRRYLSAMHRLELKYEGRGASSTSR